MERKQLESTLREIIVAMPEDVLPVVIRYLRDLEGKSAGQVQRSQFIGKILREDADLLKRLAQ